MDKFVFIVWIHLIQKAITLCRSSVFSLLLSKHRIIIYSSKDKVFELSGSLVQEAVEFAIEQDLKKVE